MAQRVIQAKIDSSVGFDEEKRSWLMALFNPDGTPYAPGDGGGTPGSTPVRADFAGTAAALAANAEANLDIAIAKAWVALRVRTNRPARVRIYANAAARTADAARAVGVAPTGDHGLLLEYITTSGDLDWAVAPAIVGYNLESPITAIAAVRITNLDVAAGDTTVTITAIPQEV